MPAAASVAATVGFCSDDVKPFGPVHEYVAPATAGVESWIVPPTQYGPPFEAVGAVMLVMLTVFVPMTAEHELVVIDT